MPANIPRTGKKRIVILGCGFAGLELAKSISSSGYQVVVIDRNNYHQFQPLLYQVATAGLEPSAISFPLRKIFHATPDIFIRLAEAQRVVPESNILKTSAGVIEYDYLVIATGADTSFFGIEGARKHSLPMKSVIEALHIRNTILKNFEKALVVHDPDERLGLMDIAVVGGGATGVEVCGALAEMKRYVLPKDYRELDCARMNIYLIEAAGRLLSGMSESSSAHAERFLKGLGVNVRTGDKVKDFDGKLVYLASGYTIRSNTLIWAAGITGNRIQGLPESAWTSSSRLRVDMTNKLAGYENIFAIGDIACMEESHYHNGHPQVAQVAIQQAENLAENFRRILSRKEMNSFHYRDRGSMATVGRNLAVVDLPWFRFHGIFAWFVWMLVHLISIIGVKNRLLIMMNWIWNYLTYNLSLRLIMKVK